MQMTEELHKNNNPNYSEFKFVGKGLESFDSIMSDKVREHIHESIKLNKIYKNFYLDKLK